MVHIHLASHARDQWSHGRLHIFLGNKLYGIHKYTVFFLPYCDHFRHKLSQYDKKYCILIYAILLITWETVKPCMRSQISCIRCSVYVHLNLLARKEGKEEGEYGRGEFLLDSFYFFFFYSLHFTFPSFNWCILLYIFLLYAFCNLSYLAF